MSIISTLKFIINHPLNTDHKVDAIIRFAKWQIGSRLVPGEIVYEWIDGAKFFVRTGETGLTQNIYCGLQEFQEMAYILDIVSPDDIFIDVGANSGSYTILACAVRGAKGYCFEPIPSTFARLVNNLRLNDLLNRVKAFNIGVSDTSGELFFTTQKDTMNHVISDDESSNDAIKIEVRPLDDLLGNEFPTIMKIDVEGFEKKVLLGAEELLKKPSLHSIIVESNGNGDRYGFSENDIVNRLKFNGFREYSYDPFTHEIIHLEGNRHVQGNILFLRNEIDIQGKLSKARPLKIPGFEIF
jgi:FkbM family methyltransferase